MFDPWAKEVVRKIQPKAIVLYLRVGFREEPPLIAVAKNRRVHKIWPLQQLRDEGPSSRKLLRFVQSNRARLKTLRNHVILAPPCEDVGVGQVEWLRQHDLAIGPGKSVLALCQSDLAFSRAPVHHFEKHVPTVDCVDHEWVGHKRGWHIRY